MRRRTYLGAIICRKVCRTCRHDAEDHGADALEKSGKALVPQDPPNNPHQRLVLLLLALQHRLDNLQRAGHHRPHHSSHSARDEMPPLVPEVLLFSLGRHRRGSPLDACGSIPRDGLPTATAACGHTTDLRCLARIYPRDVAHRFAPSPRNPSLHTRQRRESLCGHLERFQALCQFPKLHPPFFYTGLPF